MGIVPAMHTLPHLTSTVVYPFSSLRNNSGIRLFWDRILYTANSARTLITIRSGTDNLPAHKVAGVKEIVEKAGAVPSPALVAY